MRVLFVLPPLAVMVLLATPAAAQTSCETNRYNNVTTCTGPNGATSSGTYNRYTGSTTLSDGKGGVSTMTTDRYTGATTIRGSGAGASSMSGYTDRYTGVTTMHPTYLTPPPLPKPFSRDAQRPTYVEPPPKPLSAEEMANIQANASLLAPPPGTSTQMIYDPVFKKTQQRWTDGEYIYTNGHTADGKTMFPMRYKETSPGVVEFWDKAGQPISCKYSWWSAFKCVARAEVVADKR